jgi:N-acyl-D-amino-acid deacylase
LFDLSLRGGLIVDGSGSRPFRADVGVRDGKIERIGAIGPQAARTTIDADGLFLSPGFIDMHSHSDFVLPAKPWAEGKLMQGITTEVVGNCGMSAAPINPARLDPLRSYVDFLCEEGLSWEWTGFGDYLDKLEGHGVAVNVAALVGHNTTRIAVMGFAERAPSSQELEEMRGLVASCMREGAFGFSSGLIYVPGIYATTLELQELCKVAAAQGGIYSSHIRGEGQELLRSVEEAISIGEGAHIPVEISHMKASGRGNWGRVGDALKLIDDANGRGLEISFDAYPYTAGMTTMTTLLPAWALEGGLGELMKRLGDMPARKRMEDEVRGGFSDLTRDLVSDEGQSIIIAHCGSERNKPLEGRNLLEASRLRGMDVVSTVLALLAEEGGEASMITFSMSEDDVRKVLKHPKCMIGTDAIDLSKGRAHPRAYGTCPRVLSHYVREERLLGLEEAVRKMTSLPATKLGLMDRGMLQEGLWADIVVFDMEGIRDMATYEQPNVFPRGIEYVIVNGEIAVEKGRYQRKLAGKVLRHKSSANASR